MSKIIGITVGTTMPKSNLMQADPTKGDYVKGKNEFLENAIPTNVSAFANDADYATINYVDTALSEVGNTSVVVQSEPPTDTNALWIDIDDNTVDDIEGGASISVTAQSIENALGYVPVNPSSIPTKNSQLANDSQYVKQKDIENYAQPKGDYALKTEIPTVPTKVSAFENDANYAKKSELPNVLVQSVNGKTGAVQLTASDVSARPSTWTPTAQEVGAEESGVVTAHNTNTEAHNDIRIELADLKTAVEAFLDVDNETYNQLSELITKIEENAGDISDLTSGKVNVDDIVNNLTTNLTDRPLSAAQGVALKALIDKIVVPTKVSQLENDKSYATNAVRYDVAQNLTEEQKTQAKINIDARSFVFEVVETNGNFTAGATYQEIVRAFNAGRTCICFYKGILLNCVGFGGYVAFQNISVDGNDIETINIIINEDNSIVCTTYAGYTPLEIDFETLSDLANTASTKANTATTEAIAARTTATNASNKVNDLQESVDALLPIVIQTEEPTDKKVLWIDPDDEGSDEALDLGAGAVRYDITQGLTEAQKAQARNNMEAVGKNALTLGVHSDGLVYVFVNGYPVGEGIELGATGDFVGYVDENNVVTLKGVNGDPSDGKYYLKFEFEDGSAVDAGAFTVGEVERIIQCEYIESLDDSSYVDLGIVNTESTGMKVTFELAQTGSQGSPSFFGNNDIACGAAAVNSDLRAYHGGVKSYQLVVSPTANTKYTVGVNYLGVGKSEIDGVQKNWNSGTKTFSKNNTLYLFKQNGNKYYSRGWYTKIYDCYLSEGTSVSKHFVPAYRSTDDACGVLDIDTGAFIVGVGNFTHGNAV